MSLTIPQVRQLLLGRQQTITLPHHKPELLEFLGKTKEEQAYNLARRVTGDNTKKTDELYKRCKVIFNYIIGFWGQSLLSIAYKAYTMRGVNLSRRPYLAPSAFVSPEVFGFYEQYRWDTFFQNQGLLLAGGSDIAIGQLLNFVDVFFEFRRIPNALVSTYLSHCQPPLEAAGAFAIMDSGEKPGQWFHEVMRMVEEELFTEWWDGGSGRMHLRQTEDILQKHGLLTRLTPIHKHALLAGCEDGKDHNWTTVKYGSSYLPVQLNAIIYNILSLLERYYQDPALGNNKEKAKIYKTLRRNQREDFIKTFWCRKGKWEGFRNYSLVPGEEGFILYGDLSAEIWPLFVSLATAEQAEITRENLKKYYKGEFGLAATSAILRSGGTIPHEPHGAWQECQWEYPNCWPPLMYVAAEGLKNYGYTAEALEYEYAWTIHIEKEFLRLGGFPEKTAYTSHLTVAKGFYGTAKGFGWTIAVYLNFLRDLYRADKLPK